MKIFYKLFTVGALSCLTSNSFAQFNGQNATFGGITKDTTVSVSVSGKLDSKNNTSGKVKYMYDLYQGYIPAFGPLQSVTITNNGINPVDSVTIIANNAGNWQTLPLAAAAARGAAANKKDLALRLWKFVCDNHLMYNTPEAFGSVETLSPLKLLVNYGYGNSFMAANALMKLNAVAYGDGTWMWGIGGDHIITEAKTDSGGLAVVDPTRQAFYLKLDNKNLASFDDIIFNKYIYLRTKQFGPAYPFNSPLNFRLIQDYQSPTSHKIDFNRYSSQEEDIVKPLLLRGGEAITLSNTTPGTVHHIQSAGPDATNVKNIIGSGTIVFRPDFKRIPFNKIAATYSNIRIDSTTSTPVVCPTYSPGFFVIKMASPYVVTNGSVVVDWSTAANDVLTIEYSTDQANWSVVATKNTIGRSVDSIALSSFINTSSSAAVYTYYLRFKLTSQQLYSCKINALKFQSDIQANKYFIPQLQLGANTIKLTSGASANKALQLDVSWLENSSNTPPVSISSPSFPLDGGVVDSTQFTFKWPVASDPDNDAIIDYHFQLSDQPDMPYPLAPNFDRYISASDSTLQPQFSSEIKNFLNPGTRYYWHVRAMDARGAWSAWSPVWSFVPNGPKRVNEMNYTVGADGLAQIVWHTDAAGKTPVKYYVHASADRGFYPTDATRIATVTDSSYKVSLPTNGNMYYLVVSVDELGNQSIPSNYLPILPALSISESNNNSSENSMAIVDPNGYTLGYQVEDTSKADIVGNTVVAKSKGTTYLTRQYINGSGQIVYSEKQLINVTMNYLDTLTSVSGISSDTVMNVNVGGLLDGSNSVANFVRYQFDLYRYYVPEFGPLKSYSVTNNGITKVDSISVQMNDHDSWSDLGSMGRQIAANATTSRQKALSIWKYVAHNHYYYYPPELFTSHEIEDPVKFLSSYGYGNCFMIANSVKFINSQVTGDSLWIWGLHEGDHGIAECKIDSNYAVIDADRSAFYLKMDNKQFASFEDVLFDKYLLLRTQHFGPAYPYSSPINYSLLQDYLSGGNYRSAFSQYGTQAVMANTSFSLRGGEKATFSNTTASIVHHMGTPIPDSTNVMGVVGTGRINYAPDFSKIKFNDIAVSFDNIQVDSSSGQTIIAPSYATGSYFIVKMHMPYVLNGGNIAINWLCGANDNIVVEYSHDLSTWSVVTTKHGGGQTSDVIDLGNFVGPNVTAATYDFYLRFSLNPASVLYTCKIFSFNIEADFQVSKLYLPQLKLGNNAIKLTSANTAGSKNLAFDIAWSENNRNTPPGAVTSPVFPANGATVDSTKFTFIWTPAVDEDGDAIQDYHIQVSEDPDMSFPVSSNFDRYVSATDPTAQARFAPEVTNFMQPGKKYYWRVRALDARGGWSEWSNIWSFVPKGSRYVTNLNYIPVAGGNMVKLNWNTGTAGNMPVKYYIHATNERGFFPTPATVIATVTDSSYVFALTANSLRYYRIVAEDAQGNQSPPTDCYTILPPLHVPLNNTTTILGDSSYGFALQYTATDTSVAVLSGKTVIPKNIGVTYLYNNFFNDQSRLVHVERQLLFIDSADNSLSSRQKWTDVAALSDSSSLNNGDNVSGFILYPNPTQERIYVNLATGSKVVGSKSYYRVTDITGRIINTGIVGSSNFQVNLSGCPPGSYIFTIYNEQMISSKQFIVTGQ